MSKKGISKGLFNWTYLLIVVVAIVFVNIIASLVSKRFDITEDQRFSLSEGTINYLTSEKNIESRLSIKIYLEGNLPSELKRFRDNIESKLNEFKEYAGDRIEYEFIDPNTGTEVESNELKDRLFAKGKGILPMTLTYQKDAETSQVMVWPGAVITYEGAEVNTIQFLPGTGGQPQPLNRISPTIDNATNNLEYILISSIRRSTQKKRKKVAFLQGHGELSQPQTLRARALISPYFDVDDVTIDGKIGALDQVDGLVIARPTEKFSDKDLFVIDQFLMRGGRLMCFMDALSLAEDTLEQKGMVNSQRLSTGLGRMLFDYGLKINDNYVIDGQCAPKVTPRLRQPMINWFFYVLATQTNHPISRNLEPVGLQYTSEIQFIESETVALTPILTSSTNSTVTGLAPLVSLGLPLNYGNNPKLVDDPENPNNKRCLAGLAEGYFQSHFKNRIVDEYANNPNALLKDSSTREGKVFLVGNGRFLMNEYDSMPNKVTGEMMYRANPQINDLRFVKDLAKYERYLPIGNQEFIQNAVDYVMGDNSVLDIRSRQIEVHQMDSAKVGEYAGMYKLINMVLPSLLVILFAFAMHLIRRKKYTT